MAYLGNSSLPFDPTRTTPAPRDADRFSGNGSTTSFTLSRSVSASVDIEVFVENVQQEPITTYDVNGTSLNFTSAPPSGTNNIYVIYRNFQSGAQVTMPDGSVTYSKLANNLRIFTTDNLTPNGNNSVFTLSEPPADANTVMVSVDGIIQRSPIHYTTSGSTITFTSAPPAGSNVHVRHLGFRTSTTVTAIPVGTYIPQPNIASPTISSPTINNATINNATINSANLVFTDSVQNTAAYTGFRNRIINGNFNIWQRATSFSDSGVNNYYADRWRSEGYPVSGGVVISRQSFTTNQTDVPGFPTYYCRIQTNGTIASGQYWAFQQRIEAPQNLSGYETVTLSFWAKVPSGTLPSNSFNYGINNVATNKSSPTLTTSWQKLSITGTLNIGSSSGYVSIYLIYLVPGTTPLTVDIANVQVEIGSVATPFEYRPYGTELALCQRYYEKSYAIGTAPNTNTWVGMQQGLNGVDGNQINGIRFIVPKRTSPTMTIISKGGSNATLSNTSGNDGPNGGSWVAYDVGEFGFRSIVGTGGLSSSTAYCYHYTSSAEL